MNIILLLSFHFSSPIPLPLSSSLLLPFPISFCFLIFPSLLPSLLYLFYPSSFYYKGNILYFIRNNLRHSIATSRRWISVYSIPPINWYKYKRNWQRKRICERPYNWIRLRGRQNTKNCKMNCPLKKQRLPIWRSKTVISCFFLMLKNKSTSQSIETRSPLVVLLFLQALKTGNRQDLGDIKVKRDINFIKDH